MHAEGIRISPQIGVVSWIHPSIIWGSLGSIVSSHLVENVAKVKESGEDL